MPCAPLRYRLLCLRMCECVMASHRACAHEKHELKYRLAQNFKEAQYAVRGELYLKGAELKKAGRDIIFTNGVQRTKLGFFSAWPG